jgi:hypothetical protein
LQSLANLINLHDFVIIYFWAIGKIENFEPFWNGSRLSFFGQANWNLY